MSKVRKFVFGRSFLRGPWTLVTIIIFLFLHQAIAETQISYKDALELDLSAFPSEEGCDIWLSRDERKSWILVGKTFKSEEFYVYQSRSPGLHQFHIHPRKGIDDGFRPVSGAEAHASILLEKLEQANTDILYSNKRSLSISYEVEDVTSSIPGSNFESWLYYTKTSGLNWELYGPDADGVSPVPFVAQTDGLYGFKVVSADIAGQKEASPEPGVTPDILVRIDTMPPEIEIISPQPYELWESGTVRQIRWASQDEAMERLQSVSLYYSVGFEGNWVLLADELASSGVMDWKVPNSQNGKLFIQARAKDRSGNEGKSVSQPPFLTRNILEEQLSLDVRETAQGYYDTATICRKNRAFRKAIKYFRLSLQLNPYHVNAFNDVGITLLKMGLTDDAFDAFEEGLKYAPSNPNLLGNLARLYGEYEQLEEAEKVLKRLVALYPKDPNGLWLLADVRFKQGQSEQARDYWKRLLDLEFPEDSRGPRYQVQARQRLSDTLVTASESKRFFWSMR